MNEQQQMVPSLQHEKSAQEDYTWSFIRVAEGITINVVSAYVVSITAALALTIPSALILFR